MTPPLRGTVRVPGDKSIGHRACLLAALGDGPSAVRGLSGGGDNESTLRCLRALGVGIHPGPAPGSLVVDGVGLRGLRPPAAPLDCGNSGTTLRLLMGILAGQRGTFTLDGDASLRRRPMARAAAPLRALGADIALPAGDHPPVVIRGGPLRGAAWVGRVASAQVKTAVLLAGLQADGETRYREPAPTRDHTERMLRRLGVELRDRDGELCLRPPGALPAADWDIPGDPSSAAFWVAAALLVPGSRLTLPGLCLNPHRTGFFRVLERMGARLTFVPEPARPAAPAPGGPADRGGSTAAPLPDDPADRGGSTAAPLPGGPADLRPPTAPAAPVAPAADPVGEPAGTLIVEHGPLRGVTLDPAEVPACLDELPLLALLAAGADGETVITGAAELRIKESDRLAALAELLAADGAKVELLSDGWRLAGGHRPRGGHLARTHGDHRIALCAAVLGLAAPASIALDHPEVVAVSYPGFFATLAELTADPPATPA